MNANVYFANSPSNVYNFPQFPSSSSMITHKGYPTGQPKSTYTSSSSQQQPSSDASSSRPLDNMSMIHSGPLSGEIIDMLWELNSGNVSEIAEKMLSLHIATLNDLDIFCSLIINHATCGPVYAANLGNLCTKLANNPSFVVPKDRGPQDNTSFRVHFVGICQNEYKRLSAAFVDLESNKDVDASANLIKLCGLIRFLGQLMKQGILPWSVFIECTKRLQQSPGNDAMLDCLCDLGHVALKLKSCKEKPNCELYHFVERQCECVELQDWLRKKLRTFLKAMHDNGWDAKEPEPQMQPVIGWYPVRQVTPTQTFPPFGVPNFLNYQPVYNQFRPGVFSHQQFLPIQPPTHSNYVAPPFRPLTPVQFRYSQHISSAYGPHNLQLSANHSLATAEVKRERKLLEIIDPDTNEAVDLNCDSKVPSEPSAESIVAPCASPDHSRIPHKVPVVDKVVDVKCDPEVLSESSAVSIGDPRATPDFGHVLQSVRARQKVPAVDKVVVTKCDPEVPSEPCAASTVAPNAADFNRVLQSVRANSIIQHKVPAVDKVVDSRAASQPSTAPRVETKPEPLLSIDTESVGAPLSHQSATDSTPVTPQPPIHSSVRRYTTNQLLAMRNHPASLVPPRLLVPCILKPTRNSLFGTHT